MERHVSEAWGILYRFSWLDKKANINPIKDGDKCFQYAAIVALDLGK